MANYGKYHIAVRLRNRLYKVFNSCDFSAHTQTASLPQKVAEGDADLLFSQN